MAIVISTILLVIGATTVFAKLQSDLDRIWRVPAPAKQIGIFNMLRTRLLSFGLVLGLGFLLLVSLLISAAIAAVGKWWEGYFDGWEANLQAIDFCISFAIVTVLFALIYKLMPRARIAWRDVWIGAAVTALLFGIGILLIGLYLGTATFASGFGAAGSLVVLLVWVYFAAQIFLLELNSLGSTQTHVVRTRNNPGSGRCRYSVSSLPFLQRRPQGIAADITFRVSA